MTSSNSTSDSQSDAVPFGALEPPKPSSKPRRKTTRDGSKKTTKKAPAKASPDPEGGERGGAAAEGGTEGKDYRKPGARRGTGRRGGRNRRSRGEDDESSRDESPGTASGGGDSAAGEGRSKSAEDGGGQRASEDGAEGGASEGGGRSRRRRRRNKGGPKGEGGGGHPGGGQGKKPFDRKKGGPKQKHGGGKQGAGNKAGGVKPGQAIGECEGLLITDKGNHGKLRQRENQYLSDVKNDVHVAPRTIEKHNLHDGCIVKGRYGPGYGKHKFDLYEVLEVDGRPPAESKTLRDFKKLTSIDPDFHYAVGDFTGDTCMRVMDMICPVGRGQRGLVVAPPRSGKTTLLRKFAKGIEEHYPDVHLIVLLVDERPEEATEWRRSTGGEVFVSTNDELPKRHVDICEVVWRRCQRLVELGEDVILLLDSITRMARAYNHVHGNSGKTMSGGLDSRAMERPKQFFGSARNTETAGSLTILGTTLIETGSQMDRVIFEEFKGTGNMELVLSRKLADRRIFPAIDIERSGTRKEEKLHSSVRLRRITTLRRVLARMNFIEAMELLVTKLDDIERNDDFLARFDVDPEA